jgi:uncharacterized Fe-S cluster-containing radical SAM superfamily protein
MEIKMKKTNLASRKYPTKKDGYDPVALTRATERVVIRGNKRKYGRLARPLRFYGGITSAQEVGCNLRCKFCFSDKPVRRPHSTGRFYSPQQVFNALTKEAEKHGHKIISASASEGTLGKEHLLELLTLVNKSKYVFVLETNGITLGHDIEYVRSLSKFKNLHVRVSIKGTNKKEYNTLTGAESISYDLPFQALKNLIDFNISCNACLMISFSTQKNINEAKNKLSNVWPGLLKSLELEHITLFPKVASRLKNANLMPRKFRHRGNIINFKER